ncbi:MAG: hypothetical protein ABI452_06095 [Candidatus Limnocylindrales bacterium]
MTRIRLTLALTTVVLALSACGGSDPQASGDAGCPPVQRSGPDGQPLDLSGAWSGNDGGIYYIKQIGTCVWWSGQSNFDGQYPGQEWIMTFRGTMNGDGVINGDFVDVKSTNPGSGTMTIEARIDQVNGKGVVQLYRTASTGHAIGVSFWEPDSEPTPTQVPDVTEFPTAAPS